MKLIVRSGKADLNPRSWRLIGALVLCLGLLALFPRPATTPGVEPAVSEPVAPPAQQQGIPPLVASLDPRQPLPDEARAWVEETLAGMSLAQRAGQVMMVRAFGEYYAADAAQRQELMQQVEDLELGGVVLFRSEAFEAAALVADLQRRAAAAGHPPLLIAADFEWGAEFRVGGAVPFPTAMAVGATGDVEAAEWMGRASARDARALGVHWIFAPVADVNNNPRNPVINVRSFGEDPEQVGRLAAAFVAGAQAAGAMATAKHFPGHGDTGVDSHIAMPVLRVDNQRLQAVELAPFRDTIDAGVSSIMTAHLSVPAITADEQLPATLSRAVLTDLLRAQLDFKGLVVTDAMEMGGITRSWWSGQAAVEALAAGADVVLLPPFPDAVRGAIVRGVENGELAPERLEEAARRVLEYKARLGLHLGASTPALADLPEHFAPTAEATRAEEIAGDAVTLLRDRAEVLPLDARRWQRVVVVGISDTGTPVDVSTLTAALRARLASVSSRSIDGRTRGEEAASLVAEAARASAVVMAVRARVRSNQERITLPEVQQRYGQMLANLDVPVILVALGSPYVVSAFPDADAAVVAYGWSDPLQRALAASLTGASGWRGHLPVTVPGLYPLGYGIERPALDATLQAPPDAAVETPATSGQLLPDDLGEARATLQRFVDAQAFPGAVYAVGHRNVLVALNAVGRMSYDAAAPPMPVEAVFDLASLTKAVATTTVAMKAVEAGRLRLDYAVRAYVPEFVGAGKDDVTVRHLLLHVSGLPAFERFYRDYDPDELGARTRADILQRIYTTELETRPGERYTYSDLGIILLGEVLDRALGESYETFAMREIFAPLAMTHTRWNPPAAWLDMIPPTERDPWRGRIVHGEVHDENAAAMGGVSTHAGLFSSAADLAVFAQMLVNLGTYDHQRILDRATVDRWTRRQNEPDGSSRAIGWDTARPSGGWGMFSERAYGHTGFTGTSLWIDPQRDLFVVLLTNRVHPTRENTQIGEARIAFHGAVVEAVDRAAARQR
jgi:beta-glucosidase-like glycosyl hydrolase/CubicO group peptidase (beta-lactamase class C family)